MKASELRMGNLIYNKGNNFFVNPNHLIVMMMDVNHNYNPIPLTEEWLLKLGFETDHIEWWNGIICLGIFKDGIYYLPTDQISFRIGKEIEYVHQLQNLYFALTGEELILN